MKMGLIGLVAGILLGGVTILAVLSACGGPVGGTTSAPVTAQATATRQPTPTSSLAATATLVPTPAPTQRAALSPMPTPTSTVSASGGNIIAKGKLVFEKTDGGVGCAFCHGPSAKGTTTIGAPNIRGKTEAEVRQALVSVGAMRAAKLTDDEIAAVVAYLQYLNTQP